MPRIIPTQKKLRKLVILFLIGIVTCLFPIHSLDALWYGPIALSNTGADEPQIVSDLLGNAVVVWREFDGVDTSVRSYAVVSAALTPATTISTSSGIYTQSNPYVAMDTTSTTFIAVWEELNGSDSTVKASALPLGGSWTTAVDISTATTTPGLFPRVAGCPLGYFVAAWQKYNGTNNIIQVSTYTVSGGTWSAPVEISSASIDARFPKIKLTNSGNAVVVWLDATNGTIQSATCTYGGSWSAPVDISATGDANMPSLAMNASGYAVAVWEQSNGSFIAIKASRLSFGGSWSTPDEISTVTQNAFAPRVAVDTSGNAVAAWEQVSGNDMLIQAAYFTYGGAWASPNTLSSTGTTSFSPEVAFDSTGKTFAIWNSDNGDDMVVQASIRPVGGPWPAYSQISENGYNSAFPRISVAGTGGSALVCWTNYTLGKIKATAWIPPPVIGSKSSSTGSVLGGETVTITGKGFVNVTSVYFGSNRCSYVVSSPYQIIVTVPAGEVGTVNIVVTTLAGTSPVTSAIQQYTYQSTAPAPTVTSIYLNHGPEGGGNIIKIIGTNFINVTGVNFGATSAASHVVLSATVISATAPPGTGMVDVTVTTGTGTSDTNVLDQYTYD